MKLFDNVYFWNKFLADLALLTIFVLNYLWKQMNLQFSGFIFIFWHSSSVFFFFVVIIRVFNFIYIFWFEFTLYSRIWPISLRFNHGKSWIFFILVLFHFHSWNSSIFFHSFHRPSKNKWTTVSPSFTFFFFFSLSLFRLKGANGK